MYRPTHAPLSNIFSKVVADCSAVCAERVPQHLVQHRQQTPAAMGQAGGTHYTCRSHPSRTIDISKAPQQSATGMQLSCRVPYNSYPTVSMSEQICVGTMG